MDKVEMTEAEVNAGNTYIHFGVHKDETLWYVLREYPEYFQWMIDTIRTERAGMPAMFIQRLLTFGKSEWVQAYLAGEIDA